MKKGIIFLIIIGVLMLGCENNGNPSAFVGKWVLVSGSGNYYFNGELFKNAELFKDGTGIANGEDAFTWKIMDRRLVITHFLFAIAFDYKISGAGITLITDDGENLKFFNSSNRNRKGGKIYDAENSSHGLISIEIYDDIALFVFRNGEFLPIECKTVGNILTVGSTWKFEIKGNSLIIESLPYPGTYIKRK